MFARSSLHRPIKSLPTVRLLAMIAFFGHFYFFVQWGTIHVAAPLFAGIFDAHRPDSARVTGLSPIGALVTIYTGVGGIVLGWISERSLSVMFALIGIVILVGAALVRADNRHAGTEQQQAGTMSRSDGGSA